MKIVILIYIKTVSQNTKKPNKHIEILEKIERNNIIDEEDVNDQVVIPNNFFHEEIEIMLTILFTIFV